MSGPLDLKLVVWLRETMGGETTDAIFGILSNIYAYTPLLVFIWILTFLSGRGRPALSLLFSLSSAILAFQAASLMALWFVQSSPADEFFLNDGTILPGLTLYRALSMPDWPVAALTATLLFCQLRLRADHRIYAKFAWIGLGLMVFSRVFCGFAYLSDEMAGAIVGALIGVLVYKLAVNIEILLDEREA